MSERLDILILGATGFTGMHCIPYVHKMAKSDGRNLTWGVAGRSEDKLKEVLDQMGKKVEADLSKTPIVICNIKDDESLLTMAKQAKIVINCCGPYKHLGEPVVKACIEAGTHQVDVTGEPQYMLDCELKYNEIATEKGVFIVSACGMDCIPADLGVIHLQQNFPGTLNSAVFYLERWQEKSDKKLSGPTGNYGTWESLIESVANFRELTKLRQKIKFKKLPNFEPKVSTRVRLMSLCLTVLVLDGNEDDREKENGDKDGNEYDDENGNGFGYGYRFEDEGKGGKIDEAGGRGRGMWSLIPHKAKAVNGWGLPFLGADEAVIRRTQLFMYEHESQRPVQVNTQFLVKSFWHVIAFIFAVLGLLIMSYFNITKKLLLDYPEIFTFGVFSKKQAPSEEMIENTLFQITFYGEGWSEKLSDKDDQYNESCNKVMISRVKGRNPGYGAACACVVGSAVILATESEKIPIKGGVVTPGMAFSKTSLIKLLINSGITFEILSEKEL